MLGTRQEGAEAGDRCCPPLSSRLWCGRQASLLPPSPPPHTHGGPQPLGCCPVLRQLPLHGPEGPSPSSGASGTAPPHPLPLAQTVTEGADPGQPPRALSTPSSQPEWRGTVALGCRGGGPWRGVAAGAGAEAGCRWAPPDSLRVVHATSEAERNKPARWAAAWRRGAVSTRLGVRDVPGRAPRVPTTKPDTVLGAGTDRRGGALFPTWTGARVPRPSANGASIKTHSRKRETSPAPPPAGGRRGALLSPQGLRLPSSLHLGSRSGPEAQAGARRQMAANGAGGSGPRAAGRGSWLRSPGRALPGAHCHGDERAGIRGWVRLFQPPSCAHTRHLCSLAAQAPSCHDAPETAWARRRARQNDRLPGGLQSGAPGAQGAAHLPPCGPHAGKHPAPSGARTPSGRSPPGMVACRAGRMCGVLGLPLQGPVQCARLGRGCS